MAEFNYSINIPQPNTNMFGGGLIQGLSAIEGIRAARAQQQQAAALAPYQLQEAQLAIKAREQQIAHSAASAGRAAELYNLQRQAAVANQERQTMIANELAKYGRNPDADLSSLAEILPMLDKGTLDAVQRAETVKIGDAFKKIDKNNPNPEAIQNLAARSLILDTEQGKRLDTLLASLPDPAKQGLVDTALKVSNAGMSGNTGVALDLMKEQAAAYSNSKDARYQQMGQLLNDSIKTLGDNPDPRAFALMGQTLMLRAGDEKATKQFNDILTSFYKEMSPEARAEKEAGTAAKQAETDLKKFELQLKQEGKLDPDKKRSTEIQMKESFEAEPMVRSYVLRRDIAQGIRSALDLETGSGDASAITNLVKIDDPTSTVSITEAGRISGGNVPEQFIGLVNELRGKGRLSEKTRNDVLRLAKERMKTSQGEYDKYYNKTKSIASRYGLDPDNIFAIPSESIESLLEPKKKQTPAEIRAGKSIPPAIPTQQTGTAGGFNYKFREK
jgi:hypothetical protein